MFRKAIELTRASVGMKQSPLSISRAQNGKNFVCVDASNKHSPPTRCSTDKTFSVAK